MKAVAMGRVLCICKDSYIRIFEINGKDVKELYCCPETSRINTASNKVNYSDFSLSLSCQIECFFSHQERFLLS